MKSQNNMLLCTVLIVIGLFFLFSKCNSSEKYNGRFSRLAYKNSCEFQPACLYDTARWVQLSNGMEGVCTLNGMACPAFSKNHSKTNRRAFAIRDNTGTHASINHYL